MEGLEQTDPEFFQFLKENDANLLEFGEGDEEEGDEFEEVGSDDDMLEEDDEEGDEEVEGEGDNDNDNDNEEDDEEDQEDDEENGSSSGKKNKQKNKSKSMIDVTPALLSAIVKSSSAGSIEALKRLLSIFRSACMPTGASMSADGEGEDEDEREMGDQPSNRFVISSPAIYDQVMTRVLEGAHVAFYKILDITDVSASTLSKLSTHKKWKKTQLLVLSFFKSVLHTLDGLSKDSKQQGGQVSVFLITSMEPYIPLLASMPRLAKATLKILMTLWSQGPVPQEDLHNVRGHSFLRIRQMTLQLPGSMAEECFRSLYLTFARTCKTFTETHGPAVLFMAKCVAELYSLDPPQAYQQAFLYIRQLALHLRAAASKKSAEDVRQVTSWQFLNCLRLWTRVICAQPSTDQLGALAFPLAQIMFGVMAAAPSVYFLPLRFHLISCLQLLAANCQIFIPTASRLVEVMEHPDLTSKVTPSTELAPKLQYLVRLPAESITRVAVRDALILETITLLRFDSENYRHHVGFPEYAYLTTRKLRAFVKRVKNSKWRDYARNLVGQLDQYAASAKKLRGKLK